MTAATAAPALASVPVESVHQRLAKLREPFPASEIGKLPRGTCKACTDADSKVCGRHTKKECTVCGNYMTAAHIHLDFVGHAETTDRFLSVDPEWTWEPIRWTDEGTPAITKHKTNLVMWGRLTLCGVTRLGVGTVPERKEDAHKELIGDFLRNAGMRFGVALDLWRKSEKAEAEAEHEPESEVDWFVANGWTNQLQHDAWMETVKVRGKALGEPWREWWKKQGYKFPLTTDAAHVAEDHLDAMEAGAREDEERPM